ncbi:MAG: hypothetical protein DMF51_00070 [Acidobacteria bacterium]|nr:MAG: hypothetical protein DMF51_00070 [Acidobacteriota bacterium]
MSDASRPGAAGLILAFLAGAATGAAVTLLTAPRTGRETRRDRARPADTERGLCSRRKGGEAGLRRVARRGLD